MEKVRVNINFEQVGTAFEKYVRSKAILAGSSIVYRVDNQIIKEDPRTGEKTILKNTADKHI